MLYRSIFWTVHDGANRKTMKERWRKVNTPSLLGFTIAMGGFCFLLATDADGFIPLVDHLNDLFHKTGHLLLERSGPAVNLYAGIVAQLFVPIAAAIGAWKAGETIPLAMSGGWICEDLLNIARYMADAKDQKLPLRGCGEPDWTGLFHAWG